MYVVTRLGVAAVEDLRLDGRIMGAGVCELLFPPSSSIAESACERLLSSQGSLFVVVIRGVGFFMSGEIPGFELTLSFVAPGLRFPAIF